MKRSRREAVIAEPHLDVSADRWKTAVWFVGILGLVIAPMLFVGVSVGSLFHIAGTPGPSPEESAITTRILWGCLAAQWIGIASVWVSAFRLSGLGGSKTGLVWSLLAGCSAASSVLLLWVASGAQLM
ncbi:hypothetical protein ACEXQB_011090 [Herbiconiux sp. P18]